LDGVKRSQTLKWKEKREQIARPRRRSHVKAGRKLDAKDNRAGHAWADLSRSFGVRHLMKKDVRGIAEEDEMPKIAPSPPYSANTR